MEASTKKWAKRIGAVALSAAVAAGVIIGVCYGAGLFGNTETDENIHVSQTSFIADEGESNGIKLTSAALSTEEAATINATADGIVELTAEIGPDNASDATIVWTVSGTYADSIQLLDYATCSEEVTETKSGDTIYALCLGAFGEQVTITATSKSDSSIYTEIVCDYVARLNQDAGYSFYIYEDIGEFPSYHYADTDEYITWILDENIYTSSVSAEIVNPTYSTSAITGTLFDTYTVTVCEATITSYAKQLGKEAYEDGIFEYDFDNGGYDTYYEGRGYTIGSVRGLINEKLENLTADQYNVLQSLYLSGLPFLTVTASLTGDTYGLEYKFSFDVLVDFSNYYVAAEAVTANASSVAF